LQSASIALGFLLLRRLNWRLQTGAGMLAIFLLDLIWMGVVLTRLATTITDAIVEYTVVKAKRGDPKLP